MFSYKRFIPARFRIINKKGEDSAFDSDERHWGLQLRFLEELRLLSRLVILKARQQGFSSIILAVFTADFILRPNSRSVVVADIDDNATELLDRVKMYIKFYEEIAQTKVPLKYNSKTELYNEYNGARYTIGTAKNTEFGRSKTITNLHLSEFAFYPNPEKILAGAGQAVVEDGRLIIETTANGFNEFKSFWDKSVLGETNYKPLFYKASDFYTPDFLANKQRELGRLYMQEYPESALEAFLTSGNLFFEAMALKHYLENKQATMSERQIYT